MTMKEQVLAALQSHHAEIERFGVARLALFGSVARGEEQSDSDVDIFAEFTEEARGPGCFHRFMGLVLFLEKLLGRHVDLVTPSMLTGRRGEILRPHIERDIVHVARSRALPYGYHRSVRAGH